MQTQLKVSQIFLVNQLHNNNKQVVYLGANQVDNQLLDNSKIFQGRIINKAPSLVGFLHLSQVLDFLHRQAPNKHKINLILLLCLGNNPIIYFKIKIHNHQLQVDFLVINPKFKVVEYLVNKLIHQVYFSQLIHKLLVFYFQTINNLNKLDKESNRKLVFNSKLHKLLIHNF